MYLTDSISLHSTVSKLSVPQTPNPIEESNQVTAVAIYLLVCCSSTGKKRPLVRRMIPQSRCKYLPKPREPVISRWTCPEKCAQLISPLKLSKTGGHHQNQHEYFETSPRLPGVPKLWWAVAARRQDFGAQNCRTMYRAAWRDAESDLATVSRLWFVIDLRTPSTLPFSPLGPQSLSGYFGGWSLWSYRRETCSNCC